MQHVSSIWVPHILTDENMESFCNKLAVQNETWIYLSGQPSKQENKCWLQKDQPQPQVIQRTIADKKTMLLVAFPPSEPFSVSAVAPGERVNGERIINFVRHTRDLWRRLRTQPIQLKVVVAVRQRKASFFSIREGFLEARQMIMVFQSPYSPDFNLCDRFLFHWTKADFSRREFNDPFEVREARCSGQEDWT